MKKRLWRVGRTRTERRAIAAVVVVGVKEDQEEEVVVVVVVARDFGRSVGRSESRRVTEESLPRFRATLDL